MGSVKKVTVELSAEMLDRIGESVGAGEHASTSDVVREAMRLWIDRQDEKLAPLAAIRARVRRSIDEPGADLDDEEIGARLDSILAAATRARGNEAP